VKRKDIGGKKRIYPNKENRFDKKTKEIFKN
jgi:hypothetical protein